MAVREKAKKFDKIIEALEKKSSPKNLPDEDTCLDQFIHYILYYPNSATSSKRAYKALLNEHDFADWNEVRVATLHEIATALDPSKISHAFFLSRIIKGVLEGIWQTLNQASLDKLGEEKVTVARELLAEIEQKAQQVLHGEHEQRREEDPIAPVLPPWASTYILTYLGVESAVPWDPNTERVSERLELVDPSANLARRKKQLRALAKNDRHALHLHHQMVEHGRKTCTEESPKCSKCPVRSFCDWPDTVGKAAKTGSSKDSSSSTSKRSAKASSKSARKPAAKASEAKSSKGTKKPATKKPATKKPATKKPAAKKTAKKAPAKKTATAKKPARKSKAKK